MSDWTTGAVDALDRVVETVRDRTVVPAQKVTKAVVFGVLSGFFVLTAMVMLTIGAFRVLVLVTGDAWIAWMAVGAVFVLAGMWVWRKRFTRPEVHRD